MNYLLDTCIVMDIMSQNKKINDSLLDIVFDDNNKIYYSTVSVWEIEIKHQKMKTFTLTGEQFAFLCDQNHVLNLQVKNEHIFELDKLIKLDEKVKHNDPFDRLLLSQAKYEDLVLITEDKKLLSYNTNNVMVF